MSHEPELALSPPVPLTTDAVPSLRLPWSSLLSREELAEHVRRYPGLSWHVPGSQAYMIAGPWRNRRDIVEVLESRSDRYRPALWTALLERAESPYAAAMVDPAEYRTATNFYRTAGVRTLEEVLVLRTGTLPGPPVEIRVGFVPVSARGIRDLLEIDASAFDWLWRNCRAEFEEYIETPGVHVWIGLDQGESVGYVGVTTYDHWGHIDRLGVRRELQGRGYGAQLLSWAMRELHSRGAQYVQLSTQGNNERSYRLYSGFGFRPTRGSYKLYGTMLPSGEG